MTLLSIPIKQVLPGKNPRQEFDEVTIAELASSIKQHGIIQPIMVRPLNNHLHEIVCGERRWRAAQLAGLEEMPANVRELSDEEAFEISITENLQRKDVHPLDEAAAYKRYQEMKKVDVQELAAKFGKAPAYIAQRLSFNSLLPELKKDFHAGILLIGQAVLLARLQPEDQKTIMARCKNHVHKGDPFYDSVDDMKEVIEDDIMHELTHAGFDKKDPLLVKKAGACLNCQKRSGAGLLFADVKEKDRCFDGSCFKAKNKAHLLQQIDKLVVSANPMPVVVGYSNRIDDADVKKRLSDNKVKLLVEGEDYQSASKKATNATLALKVTGSEAGRIVGIILKTTEKAKAARAAAPNATEQDTVASLDEQIAGIKERGKRADELDAEKVHVKITTQLTGLKPFLEVDATFEFATEEERAAVLFILFEKLDSEDEEKVCKALGIKGDKKYGSYFVVDDLAVCKALQTCPNHVGAFIWRAAIKSQLIGNKLPPSPEAYLVRKIAETYEGVPIATYEAEQKVTADKRKGNAKKRIAELETKKKLLQAPKAKTPTQVSSDLTKERNKKDAKAAKPKKRGHAKAKGASSKQFNQAVSSLLKSGKGGFIEEDVFGDDDE